MRQHPLDSVSSDALRRLNRGLVDRPAEIRRLLDQVRFQNVVLRNGINRRNDPRTARIEEIADGRLSLRTQNFDHTDRPQIFLNFELEGRGYFFAAKPIASRRDDWVDVGLPSAIYHAERRDVHRTTPNGVGEPRSVEIATGNGAPVPGRIIDCSPFGLGLEVATPRSSEIPSELIVCFLDGTRKGERVHATIRHRAGSPTGGWTKLGLSLSGVASGAPIPVERYDRIVSRSASARARDQMALLRGAFHLARGRAARRLGLQRTRTADVPIVEFLNDRDQPIRAIVDRWGDPRGAPAVVIPPAWGRTKETLLPLAATILETFRRAGEPVTVVRFDGTNRRGESYLDPECRDQGAEYMHFTFSQAVRDIEATLSFLDSSPETRPSTVILVTFSLASIEGRRAVALDERGCVGGWIGVVGMIDLQSALRTISGGIDYAYGLTRGVRFGRHELVGVVSDMDQTGLDALEHGLVFLDDARRDMSKITVPITWIHGRDDAWMDLGRVRDALSCGSTTNRRLVEVPTGHQLRTSREAIATFQLIAEEVSTMALGRRIEAAPPPIGWLEKRRIAESERLPLVEIDLRAFWRDYLLGRDRRVGMQLITATAAYRQFMDRQIERLALEPGDRVIDLGAGTCEFALRLLDRGENPDGLCVDAVDYVPEALGRGMDRVNARKGGNALGLERFFADLDMVDGRAIPVAADAYDVALGSLLIGYLMKPEAFLSEVYRILKPGGRLVLSALRRDADLSKLYVDGMRELAAPAVWQELGAAGPRDLEGLARNFLNDASKILDLEERGRFRFWDPSDFEALILTAGFVSIRTDLSFGNPPQAVILSARKP